MIIVRPMTLIAVMALIVLTCSRGPSIVFDSPEHDFGDIKPPVDLTHVFNFTNTGSSNLKILHVKPGCSCTAFILSKNEIAPNGSGQLKVTVHAGKPKTKLESPMKDSTNVILFTNDPSRSKVELKLRVRVLP